MAEEVTPAEEAFVLTIADSVRGFLANEYPGLDYVNRERILGETVLQIAAIGAAAPKEQYTSREVYLFAVGYIRGLLGPI